MSSQKGNYSRTRAQKHKNRTAFRNDLHDKTPQQIRINSLHVSSVCQHCKGVIEWKIKYKKYKPLKQAKTCTKCQQRNVLKAYHVLCRGCAIEARVCAKCLKSAEDVDIEPPQPTREEELQLEVEMKRLIKTFPERKRRAFMRYMTKGKKEELLHDASGKDEEQPVNADDSDGEDEAVPQPRRIPHTREELLQKIEEIKLTCNNNEDDDDDDDGNDDDDDDGDFSCNSDSEDFSNSEANEKPSARCSNDLQ